VRDYHSDYLCQHLFDGVMQISEEKAKASESDTQLAPLTSKYAHLDKADKALVVLLKQEGLTQAEIAEQVGCSQSTVSAVLSQFKDREEDAIRLVVLGNLAERMANWDIAETQAAKRGDHRPVKERMEMAIKKLRAQPADRGEVGGGWTINIGIPGSPLAPPQTIEIAPVSPRKLLEPSETARIPSQ
jgi:transcriptional regulator with XRE-family HTH domain